MPSTVIPAPELEQTTVSHLRARARRHRDATPGSPETMPNPLTAMHMTGWPRLVGMGTADWRSFRRLVGARSDILPPIRVPPGEMWSIYGIGDLSQGAAAGKLAGLRVTVDEVNPTVPALRIEEFDLNVLQMEATPDRTSRSSRLAYLSPPVWFDPGTTLHFEILASAEPYTELEIALLGYWGPV